MDFIAESLSLLPQPAALYDDQLHIVGGNEPAWMWYVDLPVEFSDREDLRERTGLGWVLEGACRDGHARRRSQWGWVVGSKLSTEPGLTRPDLLLVSLHATDEDTAVLDHNRMLITLQVNERGEMAMRALRNALIQGQAAVAAQRDLLDVFNGEMGRLLESNYG